MSLAITGCRCHPQKVHDRLQGLQGWVRRCPIHWVPRSPCGAADLRPGQALLLFRAMRIEGCGTVVVVTVMMTMMMAVMMTQ